MPELILMRGIPGSGKSTWAKAHSEKHGHVVLSTDDYWYKDGSGVYKFDPRLLQEAHRWNQARVRNAMMAGRSVIVDNTNLDSFAVAPYFDLAIKYGYEVRIESVYAHVQLCINRNLLRSVDRQIPFNVIYRMAEKFETPINAEAERERAKVRKREADNKALKGAISDAQEVLNEVLEYLEDHYDICDGDDGEPRPNDAMGLGGQVERVLEGMEKLV